MDWRRILGWTALASAVGELASAFVIEFPPAAILFAALFLAAWWWLKRGGVAPVIMIGVMSAIELLGLFFYEREDAVDWIVQISFLVLGAAGVIAAIALLRERRSAT